MTATTFERPAFTLTSAQLAALCTDPGADRETWISRAQQHEPGNTLYLLALTPDRITLHSIDPDGTYSASHAHIHDGWHPGP